MTLLFDPVPHKYFIKEEPTLSLKSVSHLSSLLKPKFDPDGSILKKYVAKGKSYILKDLAAKWELTQEEAQSKWGHLSFTEEEVAEIWKEKKDTSLVKGTKLHQIKEDLLLSKGGHPSLQDPETSFKKAYDLNSLIPGIYPELMLYHLPALLTGTADIIKIDKDKTFSVEDYKGFSLDTPIPTVDGWKLMQDIQVGDSIFDGNGKPTKVKHVSDIHHNPCFKIRFDTNNELICDHEHKWVICEKIKKIWVDKIMTTQEIFEYYKSRKGRDKKLTIKCTDIELPDANLPIDPYVLGLWIGDGNRTCGTITCENNNIWEEIKRRGYNISENHNAKTKGAESRTIFGISPHLRALNLIKNKHLPLIYLRSSRKQRLDLLRGFMDADGHFHRKRRRCVMSTTKQWQCDALVELTSSLGFKPTVFLTKGSGFGKVDIPVWQICFSPTENPFLSRNTDYHKIMKGKRTGMSLIRYIESIEIIDTVPTKCLGVESNTHTYLAGKQFIKTHNTNAKIDFESFQAYDKNTRSKKPRMMNPPVSHLQDCNGIHYTIQLSLYAYFLEQFGYTCKSLTLIHLITDKDHNIIQEVKYPLEYIKKDIKKILFWYTNSINSK